MHKLTELRLIGEITDRYTKICENLTTKSGPAKREMATYKKHYGKDRRKGPDGLTHLINLLNVLAWCIFVVALVFFHYARPERPNILMYYHEVPIHSFWIFTLKEWMLFSLYAAVLTSVLTLLFNNFRKRRHSDMRRYNMVFLLVVCAAFIAVVSI